MKIIRALSIALALGTALPLAGLAPAYASPADNTITAAFGFQLPTLDSYFAGGREGYLLGLLAYDALVYRDPNTLEFKPLLATAWRQVDPLTMEFDLRKGVKFHNGDDLTAEDVAYTIKFAANPDNKIFSPEKVAWIDSVEVLDPHTVRIKAKTVSPMALNYIIQIPILPAKYHAAVGKDAFGLKPVGTGPYSVARGDGNTVIFTANDAYFDGGAKNRPKIKRLVYKTVPDVTTQAAELMTGSVDWAYYIPNDMADQLRANPQLAVTNAETFRVGFITMNIANNAPADSPLRDQRVRQALNYAIDRAGIAKALYGDSANVINSACAPVQFGCRNDLPGYQYDPDKARKLLAEAGHANGFSIDVYAYRSRPVADAILGNLRAVGINGNLNWQQYPAVVKARRDGTASLVIDDFGSSGVADAGYILSYFFDGTSDDLVRDKDVSALIEKGNTTNDQDVRAKSYGDAEQIISAQAYWVPLFTMPINYVAKTNLEVPIPRDENVEFWRASWK